MSLTSPNCPAAQDLPIMVENAVSSVPGVKEDQSRRRVGPAMGSKSYVRRGATRVEYVVSWKCGQRDAKYRVDEDDYDSATTPASSDAAY